MSQSSPLVDMNSTQSHLSMFDGMVWRDSQLIRIRKTVKRVSLANRLLVIFVASIATSLLQADDSLRPATTQTSIGLFYLPGAPEVDSLWREGDTGKRLLLRGRVLTREGQPIVDALVELWHADGLGSVDESRYRAAQRTERDGAFGIKTVLPGHIEMARDNAVFAPRHIHVVVSHPDYAPLISLIFFKGDERFVNSPYPELAIHLEQAHTEEGDLMFGLVELVLARKSAR